jgi:hypothetical protein
MKLSVLAVFLCLIASAAFAMTLEEVARLSELKTSDEIILSLIRKDPVSTTITTKEVLYLKQHHVSDRIIEYLVSDKGPKKDEVAGQKASPDRMPENMRVYYKTNKQGKRVKVVTNLDENGKRMGGPVPPEPPAPPVPTYSEAPREIYVTVKHEYPEQPAPESEAVEPDYPVGIPLNEPGYYPGYAPYYPLGGYPSRFHRPCCHGNGFQPQTPQTYVVRPPRIQRPPVSRQPLHPAQSMSAGVRMRP